MMAFWSGLFTHSIGSKSLQSEERECQWFATEWVSVNLML
jgi:hypothetical protein